MSDTENIVIDVDGVKYLIEARCPHRMGLLKYGNINAARKTLTCPLHFATFDLNTGRCLNGRCRDLIIERIDESKAHV